MQVIGAEPYDISVNGLYNVVYVANQGSNTVSVIDGKTNTVTDTIKVGTRPMPYLLIHQPIQFM